MAKTLFVTPDYTSEVTQCRTLTTPNNAEWLGVFNKALLTMLDPYNWEQINDTDLTVDETIALVTTIINNFWATETCGTGCTLPDLDSPPFRLGVNGRFQMLDPATGEWGEPTGEYEIPPTPPREEATTEERLCAAALNAASVMEQLYEAITDEIALGGDALQVAAAMVAALVTAVGGWIAAPVYAIIQLSIALFAGMIEILQALGADVWTEEFDEKLMCALLACATDTGDIVTFDLSCIREQLTVEPDIFNPTIFYEYQLFAQVLFLLETITMDGLNAAGATTGITVFDCSACDETWCYEWDFTASDGGWVVRPDFTYGEWITGRGWVSQYYSPADSEALGAQITVTVPTGESLVITQLNTWQDLDAFSPGNKGIEIYRNGAHVTAANANNNGGGTDILYTADISAAYTAGDTLTVRVYGSTGIGYGTSNEIEDTRVLIRGTGFNPFGESNC